MVTIDDLLMAATATSEPRVIERGKVQVGGVDPLGLRQINFNLMDEVLPGLNNVADKLRPFILMTWAWGRARVVVEQGGLGGATDEELRDFVDRIEAIYAWSQFLIDPMAGIPGGQALAELIHGDEERYLFGGTKWEKRRDLRRSSTGLISPLNYGPGLRSMGWLIPTGPPGVFQPNPVLGAMLERFEEGFADELAHPAFSVLGTVEVHREDVRRWGGLWSLADLTDAERHAGFDRLAGVGAARHRREGLALIEAASAPLLVNDGDAPSLDVGALRRRMADRPISWLEDEALHPRAQAWRRLQIRQLFRLGLEALFSWMLMELTEDPQSTEVLVKRFLTAAGLSASQPTADWLDGARDENPVATLDALNAALARRDWAEIPERIADTLRFSLVAGQHEDWDEAEAFDRLPLTRALRDIRQWRALDLFSALSHILEVWIIAQHAYWCVGRGLADARGRGKTLLRLRIVMEEGGWTLTPGSPTGGVPVTTPDRLGTAVSLLRQCGRLTT
jgi:hypothetical protein